MKKSEKIIFAVDVFVAISNAAAMFYGIYKHEYAIASLNAMICGICAWTAWRDWK